MTKFKLYIAGREVAEVTDDGDYPLDIEFAAIPIELITIRHTDNIRLNATVIEKNGIDVTVLAEDSIKYTFALVNENDLKIDDVITIKITYD
jgi:hypothetical protein